MKEINLKINDNLKLQNGYIYFIINKELDKIYVGETTNINRIKNYENIYINKKAKGRESINNELLKDLLNTDYNFLFYYFETIHYKKLERIYLKYLTGLLNSKLIKFWLLKKGKMQGDIYQVDKEPILDIPIHKTTDKKLEIQMIALIDKIIKAKVNEHDADNEHDKEFYHNYSKSIESDIDNLVYKLYDISDEEQDTIKSLLK
jgi:hypothetical protein